MNPDLPELAALETAEDFLDHFGIVYDKATIGPLRVPVLRLFKKHLATAILPAEGDERRRVVRACLDRAYREAAAPERPRSPTRAEDGRSATFVPLAAVSDGVPTRD